MRAGIRLRLRRSLSVLPAGAPPEAAEAGIKLIVIACAPRISREGGAGAGAGRGREGPKVGAASSSARETERTEPRGGGRIGNGEWGMADRGDAEGWGGGGGGGSRRG